MRRPNRKTLRWMGVACLAVASLWGLLFSRPIRVQYHKWRLVAAKREYLRLGLGEYRFSDKLRELLLAKPVTWIEVQSTWKQHEQSLVDLGFLHRKEYYARRGKVPSRANPDFARAIQEVEQMCPWWSYSASESQSSMTISATKEGLELWEKLAGSLNLQEDKPTKEGRHRSKKCGRRRALQRRELPSDWATLFGHANR